MLLIEWFGIIKIWWFLNLHSCYFIIIIDNTEKNPKIKQHNFVSNFLAGIWKIVDSNSEQLVPNMSSFD